MRICQAALFAKLLPLKKIIVPQNSSTAVGNASGPPVSPLCHLGNANGTAG